MCEDTRGAHCEALMLSGGCSDALRRVACAATCNLCATPNHLLRNLLPRVGAWRGGTLAPGDTPESYRRLYGKPLQLYRTFRTLTLSRHAKPHSSPAAALSGGELEFVRTGGILWYNVNFHQDWHAAASGVYDEVVSEWALAVRSVAPARVFVCVAHEADNHLHEDYPEAETADKTAANYTAMYARVQAVFDGRGVRNVVWAVDYSTHAFASSQKNVAPLLPARVDWLFFNVFLQPQRLAQYGNLRQMLGRQLAAFERLALAKSLPWGVGAFGIHSYSSEAALRADVAVQQWEAAEMAFFQELHEVVARAEYPRLKAFVMYDASRSSVTNRSVTVRDAVLKHFRAYVELPSFVVNDAGRFAAPCPAVCSEIGEAL